MPGVLVQALSLNKPVVCSNIKSFVGELVFHRKNALVVPIGDVNEIASKTLALLNNPDLLNPRYFNISQFYVDKASWNIINYIYE